MGEEVIVRGQGGHLVEQLMVMGITDAGDNRWDGTGMGKELTVGEMGNRRVLGRTAYGDGNSRCTGNNRWDGTGMGKELTVGEMGNRRALGRTAYGDYYDYYE